MLVLSRKKDEQILIDDCIKVTVLKVDGQKVRLGIEAPAEIAIHRKEVARRIRQEELHGELSLA